MNTYLHIRDIKKQLASCKRRIFSLLVLCSLTLGMVSCGPSRTYWGVDQSYPVGNGHVYYGAYGGDDYGPYHHHHKYDKKRYKKYKKYKKEREKYYKKQYKKYKKQQKHHHKHHHHHHDD